MTDPAPPARPRRRAVGPPGARPEQELDPALRELVEPPAEPASAVDDERLRREVPPHHG